MPARTAQEGAGNVRGHYDHSATWSGVILSGYTALDLLVAAMADPPAGLADPAKLARIRSDLPILIASDDAHRLAVGGVLSEQLGQRYRDAGVADVTVKLYPAARHEILDETNRDEVTGDVVGWLKGRV